MSEVTIKLKADSVEDFLKLIIEHYNDGWKEARQKALEFFQGRLKKTWCGFYLRPFTEKEQEDLVRLHFGWASRYYTSRLERIVERAQWSKTNSGGFNEVYLSLQEFEDYIQSPEDKIQEYFQRFIHVVRNLSTIADVE